LPGLAGAFLIGSLFGGTEKNLAALLIGATISGVVGVLAIQALTSWTRIREDAAIGAVLSCFFALGIVLLSVIQERGTGGEGGLSHFIYGQTAAISRRDSFITLALALAAACSALLFSKEFRLICFDREYAATQGWPIQKIDLLLMSLVVLVTVIGLQSVGLLLVIALLIIPPATARFWTEKLSVMLPLAAFFGGLSGYLGAVASTLLPRLPAGAIIVVIAGCFFFLSFLLAPARGLVAGLIRLLKIRLRISRDHILREVYELLEGEDPSAISSIKDRSVAQSELHSLSDLTSRLVLSLLKGQGLLSVATRSRQISLTEAGLVEAARLIRNHRLWEEFLLVHGRVTPSHVDYSADLAEHVLSPQVVEELVSALKARGRLPARSSELSPLPSAHPIGGRES
jgi:manganese/zinc/iron transport system permease protein